MANERGLPGSLDPALLPQVAPRILRWFRYPLHASDFHPLRESPGDGANAGSRDRRLLGYYAGKPLYGRVDRRGRVDRSQGFNGDLVALFVPSPARSWRQAELVFAHMPAVEVAVAGKRNWPAINAALEDALRRHVAAAS